MSYYETLTDYQSPSEVAGKDETEVELSLWEKNLLADLRNKTQVAVPASTFNNLNLVAEEFFKKVYRESLAVRSKNYKHSRIRVQLSRPLTVAEAEKLTTDHHTIGGRLNVSRRLDSGFLFKLRVSPNRTHVWVDADLPSRPLYDVVAAALDQHFVNVYPTAVRTFTEYHA